MEDGELGRLLPACRHVFHVECIDTWLGVSSTCPVCRTVAAAAPAADVAPGPGEVEPSRGGEC
ncbi:RING-H2 finger protein ATL3F [Panicum miliaceum]|uniref:RING-type E3 ubiquitin transferase n=1 Tax=Panicum miliaceum TaxID=4540 RepID=A0A3L6SSX3_PANMI|nr:RING-H2 finger protein ATL3F [Panicum miliaceum]